MADIFISYSREDHDVAFRLGRLLEQEGWSTWIDVQIHLGEDFRPDIEREIDGARCVVVIWTAAAVHSRWVHQEATRALAQGKLVELELAPGLAGQVDLPKGSGDRFPAITLGERVQVDPGRDALLARIASVGHLVRPSDSWNATLVVHNWRDTAPAAPIIAWEWVGVGGDKPRIGRRERWLGTPTVEYRTTIGNFWQFGYEGARVALGYLTVTKARHEVILPARDARRERNAGEYTIPFSEGGTAAELIADMNRPGGGVALDPDQGVNVDRIKEACRRYLEEDPDPESSLTIVSNDTGDPFDFDAGIQVFPQRKVWCRLVWNKRIRSHAKLEQAVGQLRQLGWNLPPEGPSTGGWLLGWKLTAWWQDVGTRENVDYRALATLIWKTFEEAYGAPPAGWTSGLETPAVPHPLDGPDGSAGDEASTRSSS